MHTHAYAIHLHVSAHICTYIHPDPRISTQGGGRQGEGGSGEGSERRTGNALTLKPPFKDAYGSASMASTTYTRLDHEQAMRARDMYQDNMSVDMAESDRHICAVRDLLLEKASVFKSGCSGVVVSSCV